jgi:hypothetical protein
MLWTLTSNLQVAMLRLPLDRDRTGGLPGNPRARNGANASMMNISYAEWGYLLKGNLTYV